VGEDTVSSIAIVRAISLGVDTVVALVDGLEVGTHLEGCIWLSVIFLEEDIALEKDARDEGKSLSLT